MNTSVLFMNNRKPHSVTLAHAIYIKLLMLESKYHQDMAHRFTLNGQKQMMHNMEKELKKGDNKNFEHV